jgi:hypothetical protein
MTDLQALKKELAEKLVAKQNADFTVETIEGNFVAMMDEWMEANPTVKNVHEQLEKAKEEKKKITDDWKESRANAATELADYFEEKPEDKDEVSAFSFRHEREPKWSIYGESLVKALADQGLYWLLEPRQDVAKELVLKNSELVEDDESGPDHFVYTMPSYWNSIVPQLWVRTIIKPTISDKKLSE